MFWGVGFLVFVDERARFLVELIGGFYLGVGSVLGVGLIEVLIVFKFNFM